MKKSLIRLLLTVAAISALGACRDESKLPAPKLAGNVPLVIPQISSDTAKNYLNFNRTRASVNTLAGYASPGNSRPVFEFTFNIDNSRDKKVKTVEVYKTFKRIGSTAALTTLGPRVGVGAYSTFPATVSVSSQDLLTGLQRLVVPTDGTASYLLNLKAATNTSSNSVQRDDIILFTFEYILEDGSRVILTPITDTKVASGPGQPLANATSTVPVLATTTQINKPYAVEAVIRDPIK